MPRRRLTLDEYRPKTVLGQNLLAAIRKAEKSVNAWAKQHGLTQTTVNRILTDTMDPKLSSVQAIADALHVETWHLLVPGLDVSNPPVIQMSEKEREMYARIRELARDMGVTNGG